VQRALDAATDKATLDVTLSLVTETLVQEAILIEDVSNAVFEAVPSLRDFLNAEGRFQIMKALDSHAMSQIVAASPPPLRLMTRLAGARQPLQTRDANAVDNFVLPAYCPLKCLGVNIVY
jgi:hypothetical protein